MDQNQTKLEQHDTDKDIFEDELPEPRTGTQKNDLLLSDAMKTEDINGACGELDVAAAISHIYQLLAELQRETTLSVESKKSVEFRLEEAKNAARRTVLAEEFARSSGEAAQRLAKETEIATRQAAAAKSLLEAKVRTMGKLEHVFNKTLEIEALRAAIRTLRTFVDVTGRREAFEIAMRASEDAAKKATLAKISKLETIIAEVKKRQTSLEKSMENLEEEVKAATIVLEQEREVRDNERFASALDKEQLKTALEKIAELTAEASAMRARAGEAMASYTKEERPATPFLTTQH